MYRNIPQYNLIIEIESLVSSIYRGFVLLNFRYYIESPPPPLRSRSGSKNLTYSGVALVKLLYSSGLNRPKHLRDRLPHRCCHFSGNDYAYLIITGT